MHHRIWRLMVRGDEGQSSNGFELIPGALHLDAFCETGPAQQITKLKGLDPLVRCGFEHASYIAHKFLERWRSRQCQSFLQAFELNDDFPAEDVIVPDFLPKAIIFRTFGAGIGVTFVVPLIRECF